MTRTTWTTTSELVGFGLLDVAAFRVGLTVGMIATGLTLLFVGFAASGEKA